MKKVKNYSRFYALIKNLPGDREGIKEELVSSFTDRRTRSLHEMTTAEYNRMCDHLQEFCVPSLSRDEYIAELKKRRSAALNRMQKLGIDTADRSWAAVDNFCLDPRIAGKVFRHLSLDELKRLIPKLEAIARKPRRDASKASAAPTTITVPAAPVGLNLEMYANFPGSQVIN